LRAAGRRRRQGLGAAGHAAGGGGRHRGAGRGAGGPGRSRAGLDPAARRRRRRGNGGAHRIAAVDAGAGAVRRPRRPGRRPGGARPLGRPDRAGRPHAEGEGPLRPGRRLRPRTVRGRDLVARPAIGAGPDPALIKTCIHCGFCLPTCPTYLVWGEEMDSPRGRIVLMRQSEDASGELGSVATHIDRCLGCMACVTACPSGVRYDVLIEQMRPEVERRHRRTPADRAFRRFCFELFTHPGRLRTLVPALVAGRRLGLQQRLQPKLQQRFPRLAAMARVTPDVKLSAAWKKLPERTPARPGGPARGTVGMLQGCVARVFFTRTNEATIRVLSAEGFDVVVPPDAGCCGALLMHSGADEEARQRARATIAAFEGCDTVAVNAAGCGSAMKEYGRLLASDPEWAGRAEAFTAKVKDVSEVLAGVEPRAPRRPVPLTVAYHDACH